MSHTWYGLMIAGGLFLSMLLLLEMGRRMGNRRLAQDPEGTRRGVGVVDGAVFGLLGLLIAFSFSGASTRFDARRQMIVEEANDISTAWLRLDLLPPREQSSLRENFRQYVDSRLAVYRRLPDIQAARTELARSTGLQSNIWTQAISACKESPTPAPVLLLPALNQMFDIATKRVEATKVHQQWLFLRFWAWFRWPRRCWPVTGWPQAKGEAGSTSSALRPSSP
jgi:hypothetical protein